MSILLTCSAGGHLSEMRQLDFFYTHYAHFFVTFERADSISLKKSERVYFIERPARNPLLFLKALWQAWKIISLEKPELIISTGADVTVPVCLVGKLHHIPIVLIESFCRPYLPSKSAWIVSKFADHIIYQWPQLKKFYERGIYGGNIFASQEIIP